MIEHFANMAIESFRKYDIEANGQLDFYMVPRAKTETVLETIQYFYICFILGITIVTIY